jgi:hypothetical protein
VTPTPDFAESIIGRAFARPVGSNPATDNSRCGRQWLVAELLVLRNCFRFSGIAEMAGPVAGTTRSRMTQGGHRLFFTRARQAYLGA